MAQGWQDVQAALNYYRQGSYRTEAALSLILLGRPRATRATTRARTAPLPRPWAR